MFYVSGTNQKPRREAKKHGAARERKLVLILPRAFSVGGEAESEDSQQPNARQRRKLTSPPPTPPHV